MGKGNGGATTRGGGQGYRADRITRMIRPGMAQLPPIREQARALDIGPANQRILDRQASTYEHERRSVERTNDWVWRQFREHAYQPMDVEGNPARRPRTIAACTSVEATTRQWEDLQRFRLCADLEADPLTRRFACAFIYTVLRRNDWMFSRIAEALDACTDQTPREFELPGLDLGASPEQRAARRYTIEALPQSADVVAGILSPELSARAVGSARGGAYVSAARPTLTPQQAHDFQVARNRFTLGLEPIPDGVLLFRPQIRAVLEYLNRNPIPMPQERF